MSEFKPIPNAKFYVELDGLGTKLVKSITDLNFTEQTTSGGLKQSPNFKIEVYLAEGDMDLYNWMLATIPKSEGGKGKWSENRKNGALSAYDSGDEEIMRWKITNSWIKSYKISEFATNNNNFAVETFEIVCEQLDKMK